MQKFLKFETRIDHKQALYSARQFYIGHRLVNRKHVFSNCRPGKPLNIIEIKLSGAVECKTEEGYDIAK